MGINLFPHLQPDVDELLSPYTLLTADQEIEFHTLVVVSPCLHAIKFLHQGRCLQGRCLLTAAP